MARSPVNASLGVEGLDKVSKVLDVLKAPNVKRIMKRHNQRFAATVRDDMRQGAPKRAGKLRRAIKSRSTSSGGALVEVDKKMAPHWALIEKGTLYRKTKKGANRGITKAVPYIEPARKRARDRLADAVANSIAAELSRSLDTIK